MGLGGTQQPASRRAVLVRGAPAAPTARPVALSAAPHRRARIAGRRARANTAVDASSTPVDCRAAMAANPTVVRPPGLREAIAPAVKKARSAIVSRSRPSLVRPRSRASLPSSQSLAPPATITSVSARRDRRHPSTAGTSQNRAIVTASAGARRSRATPSPPSAMPRCQSSICHTAPHQSRPEIGRNRRCRLELDIRHAPIHAPAPATPQTLACPAMAGRAERVSPERSYALSRNDAQARGR